MQRFVAREAELSQLHEYLDKSYEFYGGSQVCLISGEAGTGKTTLLSEFSEQATQKYDDLHFLIGTCNAQTGVSDSYLPFRRILHQLLGGDEIDSINQGRSQEIFKTSGRALIECAPELIGSLIPGAGLVALLGKFFAEELGWFNRLKKVAERADRQDSQLKSEELMFQYTELLRSVATEIPLVITIDDLHWSDEASVALFSHLTRELKESPILFIGMYRPSDLEIERNHKPHPFRGVLNHIQRYHGVGINLDTVDKERGRTFIDAFLDAEPNYFDEDFRHHFFKKTDGQPFFTTQIFINMYEDNDITQDEDGYWVTTSELDWNEMPVRVEAVIEERINRLGTEQQELLQIASVQGEEFTAEVLMEVHEGERLSVLRSLNELEQKHRLIKEDGEVRVGKQTLSQYAFNHNLYQKYLYELSSRPMRRLWHGKIADSLVRHYGDDNTSIISKLAYHYERGGNVEQAVKYLIKSAEFSLSVNDMDQALIHVTEAQKMIENLSDFDDVQRGWLYYLLGRSKRTPNYTSEERIEIYLKSISILKQTDSPLYIHPLNSIAELLRKQGDYGKALNYLKEAYNLAVKYDDQVQRCRALRIMSIIYRRQGDYNKGIEFLEFSHTVAQKIDDQIGLIRSHNSLAIHETKIGDFSKAQEHYESAIELSKANQDMLLHVYLGNLGHLMRLRGLYDLSLKTHQEALGIAQNLRRPTAFKWKYLAELYYHTAQYEQAKQALSRGQPKQSHQLRAEYLLLEGLFALHDNKISEAVDYFTKAKALEYLSTQPQVLSMYAIALLRAENILQSVNIAMLAVDACSAKIDQIPRYYQMFYHRGLAQATLAIANQDKCQTTADQTLASYKKAYQICHEPGVLRYQQRLLDELKPLDVEELLAPIYRLFGDIEDETI